MGRTQKKAKTKDKTSPKAKPSPKNKTSPKNKDSTTTDNGNRTASGACRQDWRAYNAAQTNEKEHFEILLYDLCSGVEEPLQTFGRPRVPIREILFSAVLKEYLGLSGRRLMGFLEELYGRGFLSCPPRYNTLTKYVDSEELTPYLHELVKQSSLPLKDLEENFIADASGFGSSRFVRWFNVRWKREIDNHDWVKANILSGELTHIVTSVVVSGRHAHDSRFLEPLLEEMVHNFNVKRVLGDKGYSTKKNLRLVERAGAEPYILFKSNARDRGKCPVWNKYYHFFRLHEEEFLEIYHKRSNVESTFSMIKRQFGANLKRRTKAGQINEVLCKIIAHNICVIIKSIYKFGIEPTLWSNVSNDHKVLVSVDDYKIVDFGGLMVKASKSIRQSLYENPCDLC